ncbi:MAG: CHAT domain-containing protein [Polyangiales bacterium]
MRVLLWLLVMTTLLGCRRHRGSAPHPKVRIVVSPWPARPHEIRSDRVIEVTIEHARDPVAVLTVVDAHDRPLAPVIPFERDGDVLRAIVPRRALSPHVGRATLKIARGSRAAVASNAATIDRVDLDSEDAVWDPGRIVEDDPEATLRALDEMRGAAPDPALADAMEAEAAFAVGRTRLAEIFAERGLALHPEAKLERRLLRVRIAAVAEARNDFRADRSRLAAIASLEEIGLDRALDLRLAELHDRNEGGPRQTPAAARALLEVASPLTEAAMICRAGAIERGTKLATKTADRAICLVRAADAATDAGKLDDAEKLYAQARTLLGDRFLPREQREAWYSAAYLAEERGDLEAAFERARIACRWVDRLMVVERDLGAREALSGNLLSYFVVTMRMGLRAKKAESAIAAGEFGKGRVLAALLRGGSGVDVGTLGAWFETPDEGLPDDLGTLRARLGPDEVVVTYTRLGRNAKGEIELAIGVVTHDEVSGTIVPTPEDLREIVDAHAAAVVSGDRERAKSLGTRLETLLVAPIRSKLRPRVSISPHLALHGVAWPALFDGEHWLVERHVLARIPPLPAYQPRTPQKPARWTSAIAPPHPPLGALPGFEAIADSLIEPIAPKVDLRGRAVTVDRTLASLKGADALLYAGHAHFDADAPLRSALLVSNGEIRATDLLRLRRPLDVVVLVGCETGRTIKEPSFADEAIGLPRAFLAGGARQVVGALLEVVDRDAEDFARALFERPISGDLALDVARAQRCMISGSCASRGPAWGTYVVDVR